MATSEVITLTPSHPPHQNAIDAFNHVLPTIKSEIVKSRHHWDKHEPKMWSRAAGLSDHELTSFKIEEDLVAIRSATVSYGTIILGKIRIPAVKDDEGEGFVHVRIHDPPKRGDEDVLFHSLFTDEGPKDADGHVTRWRAVQTDGVPLVFFNE